MLVKGSCCSGSISHIRCVRGWQTSASLSPGFISLVPADVEYANNRAVGDVHYCCLCCHCCHCCHATSGTADAADTSGSAANYGTAASSGTAATYGTAATAVIIIIIIITKRGLQCKAERE